jgi:hypothetical protein
MLPSLLPQIGAPPPPPPITSMAAPLLGPASGYDLHLASVSQTTTFQFFPSLHTILSPPTIVFLVQLQAVSSQNTCKFSSKQFSGLRSIELFVSQVSQHEPLHTPTTATRTGAAASARHVPEQRMAA